MQYAVTLCVGVAHYWLYMGTGYNYSDLRCPEAASGTRSRMSRQAS